MSALGIGLSFGRQPRVSFAKTEANFLIRSYKLRGSWVNEAQFFEAFSFSGAGGTIWRGGQMVCSDAPRVGDSGLLVEDARTNWISTPAGLMDLSKVSLRFAGGAGTAILSRVDDGEALAAAGLGAFTGGYAYKLDNQSGLTSARIEFHGATPDDQALALSAWVRGGYGRLRTAFTDPVNAQFSASNDYRRIEVMQSDGLAAGIRSAGDLLWVEALPGQVLWIVCPQMETGDWVSSYIPNNGAPASRGRDMLSIPRASLGIDLTEGELNIVLGRHRRGRVAARILGTDGANGTSLLNFVGNSDTQIGTFNGAAVLSNTGGFFDQSVSIGLAWGGYGRSLVVAGNSHSDDLKIGEFESVYIASGPGGSYEFSNALYEKISIY